MAEATTKVSNTWWAVAGVVGTAAFLGALSWASWMTLSQISTQTQLAAVVEKIDAIKDSKDKDDRRNELDADKLERRLASIETKLDRALGLAGVLGNVANGLGLYAVGAGFLVQQDQRVMVVNDRIIETQERYDAVVRRVSTALGRTGDGGYQPGPTRVGTKLHAATGGRSDGGSGGDGQRN